jgi:septum formation protein
MQDVPLILASSSPRRKQLLTEGGSQFAVIPPADSAESTVDQPETPTELVTRLAFQKAQDVALRTDRGLIIGCDTVAECQGQILGKPASIDHARQMLDLLRGREHHVYSGLCLWRRPGDIHRIEVDITTLRMDQISDDDLENYLATDQWQGKAGAFGYQDGLDWVHILSGSESNVVGLPMELLAQMLQKLSNPK